MAVPEKPFYALDEMAERWSVSVNDLGSFAVGGSLNLAVIIHNLQSVRRRTSASSGRSRTPLLTGVVSVDGMEVWRAFKGETVMVTRVRPRNGSFKELSEESCPLVSLADLYISSEEKRRFETAYRLGAEDVEVPMASPPGKARSQRGKSPSHVWDAFWIELSDYVYREGRPETQAELIRHMLDWFVEYTNTLPDESTVRKKVQRYWRKTFLN